MANWLTRDDVKVNLRTVDSKLHDDEDIDRAITDAVAEARAYLTGAFGGDVVQDWTPTTVPEDIKNKTAVIAAAMILDQFYDVPIGDSGAYKIARKHLSGYAEGKFMALDSAGENIPIAPGTVTYHDNDSGREFQRGNDSKREKFDRWKS